MDKDKLEVEEDVKNFEYLNSFISKYYYEFLDNKILYENKLKENNNKIEEIEKHIKLLEKKKEKEFDIFSPRSVNEFDEKKENDLRKELEVLKSKNVALESAVENNKLKDLEIKHIVEILNSIVNATKDKSNMMLHGIEILEIQEMERQRIARDLHDSTVQNLTSMVHKAELASKLVDMDIIRCKLELFTMIKSLREIIDDMRSVIYNLRPMSFDDIGLEVTIERFLAVAEREANVKIHYDIEGEIKRIDPVISLTLLRIVQEAVNNSKKHASAKNIYVNIKYLKNYIEVTLKDDGIGFDINEYGKVRKSIENKKSGFGLSMLHERVYLLSGEIKIESQKDKGTKVYIKIPLDNKEE